jgi:cytochrome P450
VTQAKAVCPVSFDHNSAEHTARGPLEVYRELRTSTPVAWSDNNGGYWVVTSYAQVSEVLRDSETYSSGAYTRDDGTYEGGIFVPAERGLVPMIPTEVDAPQWEDFRRLLAPRFSPTAVWEYRTMIAELATHYVDQVIEAGTCDLAVDIAGAIPASAILNLLGVDVSDWMFYAEPFHNALGYPPDSTEYNDAVAGLQEIVERIRALIAERRQNPGADLISHVAGAEIGGKPIDDEEAMSVVYTLFSGGVDTTTTLLVNIFAYLSRNPEARAFLLADMSRLPVATEEFMRMFTPVQALARTVRKPTVLGGQSLSPGERVLLAYASANRDASTFENPDECQLDRMPNPHVSWGVGLHRCLGSHLARLSVELILNEVLTRMPDFAIDEQLSRQYPNLGIVNGWATMPATFSPGKRISSVDAPSPDQAIVSP